MVAVKKSKPLVHYVEPYFGGGSVFFRRHRGVSPIPYHGGKHYLAEWILTQFPENMTGGDVSEVINDIDGSLTDFLRVLQSKKQFDLFRREVELMPVSRNEWEFANERLASTSIVQRAVGYFVRARQSRQGLDSSFTTPVRSRTRRGMQEQVSRWLTSVEGLPEIHRLLQRCLIENMDAIELIKREDSPTTFCYLDPPYMPIARVAKTAYRFEYTRKDHLKLLYTLGSIKGKFLLSGYWTKEYETACREYGWKQCRKVAQKNSSSSKSKPASTEYLWRNY